MCHLEFLEEPSPDQIRQITALYRAESWWDGPDNPDHVAALVRGSHCFVLALLSPGAGGEIVGMGRAISDRASDAYIQDVTVKQGFRHQQIGTRIIQKIVERLTADGLRWIALVAERGSAPFYAGIGFSAMENSIPMKMREL